MKKRIGAIPNDVSGWKGFISSFLARFPKVFLLIEKHRRWISWDRRVYLFFVSRGQVVADVGANAGAHTVLLSNLVGPAGKVFSFEPLAANLERLKSAVNARATYRNVEIFETAVGNPTGGKSEVEIFIPGQDLTQASIGVHRSGSWTGAQEVHAERCTLVSLDHALQATGPGPLTFLKIDVEGAELEVLKGATNILRKDRPVIYCEMFDGWTAAFGYTPMDLMAFVSSLGYSEVRVFDEDRVTALSLSSKPPSGMFAQSVNALFLGESHKSRMSEFERFFGLRGLQQS